MPLFIEPIMTVMLSAVVISLLPATVGFLIAGKITFGGCD